MFWNWISIEFKPIWILSVWFIVYIVNMKFGFGYYFRRVFKIKQTKGIKLLDCLPCQSFWIALFASLNPVVAMAVYFMAVLVERK